ncbi:adenylate kinase-like protein 2 [Hepatocystis sp. ex Piliocolobus tephrosceles]|nr:adenylate kinase-like protein 2 [Hepatocystis sp. ex Piliocolobus tephrosceles]
METLLDSEMLKQYDDETNEYIRKKNIQKLFNVIVKNVLLNKPENVYLYIYKNIYSFLLNKIYIYGPPLLKITSTVSSTIANTFDYYHLNSSNIIQEYCSSGINDVEDNSTDKKIISEDLISFVIQKKIDELDAKKKRGYVIEGFPSTNLQALSCLHQLPTHVFVLYTDKEYIYKKYEEETGNKLSIETTKDDFENHTELFESKEINVNHIKDQVKTYLRNISGVLEVLGDNKKVINLKSYDEKKLIDYVMDLVSQNKNEWDSLFDDSTLDKDEQADK